MSKFDINVFTEQLTKCYTLLNQQEIIIDNVKQLMKEFNNIDISGSEDIKAIQESINSLENSISELKEDFNSVELPNNLKHNELILEEGEQSYSMHATSEDGLYIYENDNDIIHFYDNKIYANNIISTYTMPPKISYDVNNIYASGNFTTSLSPIPSGETLTIRLEPNKAPTYRTAFDWTTISDAPYQKSLEYLSRQVINVNLILPDEYYEKYPHTSNTIVGVGKQISNNFFPSSENRISNKVGAVYLVSCFAPSLAVAEGGNYLTLIVYIGVDEYDDTDKLYYSVINTINYEGFLDYH